MFETRYTIKLWPNAYIKFGGGRPMRLSKGGGDAQADRFTGLLPRLLVSVLVAVILLVTVRLLATR